MTQFNDLFLTIELFQMIYRMKILSHAQKVTHPTDLDEEEAKVGLLSDSVHQLTESVHHILQPQLQLGDGHILDLVALDVDGAVPFLPGHDDIVLL